jgi:RHS repeat-associated protein
MKKLMAVVALIICGSANRLVAGTFVYSPASGTIPALGTDTLSVTFNPTNTTEFIPVMASVSLTVTPAAPVITWATPAAITYNTALSAIQLNATASVAGTFVYSPATGTVLTAGVHTLSVTFTPTDTTDYTTATSSVTLTVNKAAPAIVWATPTPTSYGTALSSTQLNASVALAPNTSNLPATSAQGAQGEVLALSTAPLPTGVLQSCTTYYSQAPSAGQSLTFVIFNPSGGWNYTIANSFTVTATASAGFQTFTAPPIAITAGQVVGYWAASGIEPGDGGQTAWGFYLNNQATLPSGSTTYDLFYDGFPVTCNVASNMATPNMNIAAPTNALSAQTLVLSNAPLAAGVLQSCSTYYYAAPAAGQSLTFVIFNPNNGTGSYNDGGSTNSYTIANSFTVTAATSAGLQTFTAPPIAVTAGQMVGFWAATGAEPGVYNVQDAFGSYFLDNVTTLPSGPTTYTGYHGDYPVACVVSGGQFTYSPAAGTIPPGGTDTLSVTFTPTDTTDYTTATASVNLVVSQMAPTITWATPAAIGYGTALSATQLNATASVPGTFSYSPAVGAIPATGTDTLSVTFTPTSSAYATVTQTVSLAVLSQIFDAGTVTLTVDGVLAASTNYGAGATPSSIASGLAAGVTAGSFVNVTAVNDGLYLVANQAGAGTNYSYSVQTTSYDSTDFSQPSFVSPPVTGSLDGGANADSTGQPQTIYSFAGGYDGVGNLTSYSDSSMGNQVMGSWGYTYDTLNRLVTGTPSSGPYNNQYLCWAYDSFGNRTAQALQTTSCPTSATTTYNVYNQVIGTPVNLAVNGFVYDASGDVTNDNVNQYLYDAEGRICAMSSRLSGSMTGYVYGADGTRVAKGSITSWSCDPNVNGFTTSSDYILGPSNQQITELRASSTPNVMIWHHTNIWLGGNLLGTYDEFGTHFYFDDPLGTRRAQTDSQGVLEQTCQSLPYGDGETCAPTPTEHLFTGKERDAESGLDYFGARYYGSSMGRFMSPDPAGNSVADFSNPQSWNMYSYVLNNPLKYVDPTGLDCAYLNDAGDGIESSDRNSGIGECNSNGGYYVSGQVNTLNVGSNGSYQFGYQGVAADGNLTTTTYLNYLGPNTDNSLSSAYGAAGSLLSDFLSGNGATVRNYDLNTIEGRNFMQSKGMQQLNAQIKAGCAAGQTSGKAQLGSGQAAANIPYDAANSPVGGQVGGYAGGTYTNNGDSTNISFSNTAGSKSFGYHAVPDRPSGSTGPGRSIIQNFNLSEPNPCTHP